MEYRYRKQPWKTLFIFYVFLTTLFIRVPVWTILSIPRSSRPRRSWDLKRAVLVRIWRYLLHLDKYTGPIHLSPDHRGIRAGKDVLGLWIPPAPEHLVVGKLKQWAQQAEVAPIRIPGYWIHKAGSSLKMGARPQPGEKVVLSLHGGAYTHLSAHPHDLPGEIARGLLKHVNIIQRVFAPEYRLASAEPFGAAHPFPTALLDALTGYLYLVNGVGFSPSDIIVEGDSAGGGLATALTRYLIEYIDTPQLPGPPDALLLLSPWVDVSKSHNQILGGSSTTFIESDLLGNPSETLHYALLAYTGPHGPDAAEVNPYISPASLHPDLVVDFKSFPRTFLVSGGAEVLLNQLHTLRDRMLKDMDEGNGIMGDEGRLRYYEPPDAIHDYLVFAWHEPEVTDTLKAVAEWISLGP